MFFLRGARFAIRQNSYSVEFMELWDATDYLAIYASVMATVGLGWNIFVAVRDRSRPLSRIDSPMGEGVPALDSTPSGPFSGSFIIAVLSKADGLQTYILALFPPPPRQDLSPS